MKKSQLIKIIKESIKQLMKEEKTGGKCNCADLAKWCKPQGSNCKKCMCIGGLPGKEASPADIKKAKRKTKAFKNIK